MTKILDDAREESEQWFSTETRGSTVARMARKFGRAKNVSLTVVMNLTYVLNSEVTLRPWKNHPQIQDQIRHVRAAINELQDLMLAEWWKEK